MTRHHTSIDQARDVEAWAARLDPEEQVCVCGEPKWRHDFDFVGGYRIQGKCEGFEEKK